MTFIDGVEITKRHNGAWWCAITVQRDKSSAAAWTCSVRDCRRAEQTAACSTVHTVGPWKLKLHWPVDVSTLGSSTPPVDADRRRGLPGTLSTGIQYILPVDRQVRRHGYISIHGPRFSKWFSAAPKASGDCAGLV